MMRINSLVLALALATGCQLRGGGGAGQEVANVNGLPITVDEVARRIDRGVIDDDNGEPLAKPTDAQKRAVLDSLVVRRLILQQADRANVLVGLDEVESAFQRMRQGWNDESFEEVLRKRDLTKAELKAEIREDLLIKRYFREHVFARIAVTDEDINAYIATNPEVQIYPEQVHALQIVVKTAEKAKTIAQEIKQGLAFEDAAAKYSLSPEAKSGGDLGFFARETMPTALDEACFTTRVGQVSKVVESDYGFHLFKIVELREARVRPVMEVRNEVERLLRAEAERRAQDRVVAEMKQKAEITIHDSILAHIR